ncbi:MAG TPA: TolC family protein [Gemmatimonadaceae bacterium]|nr:TolC family protein [Gemmatimonadaceae bacterium]
MPVRISAWICTVALAAGTTVFGQTPQPLTLREAVDSAVARGTRVALARADSATARAGLTQAREWPNPTLTFQYTKDTPHYHGFIEFPIDYPWLRSARIHSADLANHSAGYRFAFERAGARFDAETTYVRAQVAGEHARLSHENSIYADSLLRLAHVRREAGDASDLDVELATVTAGQSANAAAADSLAAIGAVLDLQALLGMPSDQVHVVVSDSLMLVDAMPADTATSQTLQVAAAEEALGSERAALSVAKRAAFATPSISLGVEGGDPTQPYPLPSASIIFPFPLFNQNRGQVGIEAANVSRAQAELARARRESAAAIAAAHRALNAALMRAQRDRGLLESANRVAAMSLTAFAEGAQALPSVLEARKSARDALVQYVDDVGEAAAAAAAVRLFTSKVGDQ